MEKLNRRHWIKKSVLATTALSSLPMLGLDMINGNHSIKKEFHDDDQIRRLLYNENHLGPSTNVKKSINALVDRSNRYATFHEYDYSQLKR